MTIYDYRALYKNVRAFGAWTGAVFLFFNTNFLAAQSNVTFEATVAAKEVIVGVPFELTFTLKNAEGTRFTPPSFSGFRNGGISEMRGMSIINGRSSTNQTWSLELTANKPGIFSIGPATVTSGGRTISTKPLTVNVLLAASNSKTNVNVPPGSDDKVFVAAEFDRKEVYVGQQVTWRIRLYTQLSVEGYDIIALPEFEGFFSKEKIRYDKRVEYLSLRGKKYAVRTLHEFALFAQEAGEISVGAARVSVGIEQPGAQGFLFGPKPVNLQTEPISLKVKALPQPTPPEFTGGVGEYEWEVKADTTLLSTDDALTIVVEVKGNGDTRRFAPPKITVPPNCEIFEPRILEEEEYEGETEILHRKKFEYVVLPKDTGNLEINPVLAYFDTDSNRYCHLRTAPIRFTVTPGKNYQSPSILPDATATEPTVMQPPSLFEQVMGWLGSPLFWVILALPFLVLGIFALLKKKKVVALSPVTNYQSTTSPTTNPPVTNHQSPIHQSTNLASARQRFTNAGRLLKGNDPHRFYDELFRALQAWLSARFGLQPSQMNDADVSALLLQRGAAPIRIQALLSVWHTCEQAIYGGQAQAEQMESTWQMAGQVMEALEREVR
ncbi:MAG: protein BatD [Phycisphaerae bacterium]|nr:protein BatD [Saprospiraceae bacterium]